MLYALPMALGATCSRFFSTIWLSLRLRTTSPRRSTCSAVCLRLPATNRFTSTTALDRLVSAASRSDRLPSTTLDRLASRSWNWTIWALLSRSTVTKVCRFLMTSTMSPLPSARIRLSPASCLIVSRSFIPLPSSALAALSMNRPTDDVDTSLVGPRSVASRSSWVLISSHSTGIAVRSVSITAPSRIRGASVRPSTPNGGVSCT